MKIQVNKSYILHGMIRSTIKQNGVRRQQKRTSLLNGANLKTEKRRKKKRKEEEEIAAMHGYGREDLLPNISGHISEMRGASVA